MKLLEHAPESGWNDGDTIEYKLDREIVKMENVSRRHYPDGFMYAEVTFEPAVNEDFIMTRTLNTPFCFIAKFDTEFEGDYWEAGQ